MLIAKSPLQGVICYLSIPYLIWIKGDRSWGKLHSEECSPSFSRVYIALVLNISVSMYLNIECSQVSCADEINVLESCCTLIACHEWLCLWIYQIPMEWKKDSGDCKWLIRSSAITCILKSPLEHSWVHTIAFSILLVITGSYGYFGFTTWREQLSLIQGQSRNKTQVQF